MTAPTPQPGAERGTREELAAIRERAERHDMPDPCAPGDECECCTTARDSVRLVKALEAVLEDHKPRTRATHTGCRECGQLWPCSTLRAIEAALTKAGGAA